jgi:3-phosphoshikimate 1-carboxyvinyltransferase
VTLDESRRKIDAIDAEILRALAERFVVASEIAREKRALGVSPHDPAREREVMERISREAEGRFPLGRIQAIYREILLAGRVTPPASGGEAQEGDPSRQDKPQSLAIPATSRSGGPLRGTIRPIGDKSITHRALILAAMAQGTSLISHPNPGEDCARTAQALSRIGAALRPSPTGWEVTGGGRNLRDPDGILDLGNSGTGIRLLAGVIAGRSLFAVLTGDASLRRRPMRRIAEPLVAMGATVLLRDGEFPPLALKGGAVRPAQHRLAVASAQVKSCLLLAGLGLQEGEVVVEEPSASRDHTERLMGWLGLPITRERNRVTLRTPIPAIEAFRLSVPADFSAATFYAVAALLVPGSDVRIEGVLINPTRSGALDVLRAMGANLEVGEVEEEGPEATGTIRARGCSLRGTVVEGEMLLRAIDEVPVLAVAAAAAEGETLFRDARELRMKESDRIEATASLVRSLGAEAETGPDWLRIVGRGRLTGGVVASHGDHRIAMSALVAGLAASEAVHLDDIGSIATSDPTFIDRLVQLGADLS